LSVEKQVVRPGQDDNPLKALASAPRPVGSPANHEARAYCADHLRSLGFEVAERPFVFSGLPGRYGAQVIGATTLLGLTAARFLLAEWFGQLTAALVIMLSYWFSHASATREPWFRETGINLEARRGTPKVWLVAHIDSKSQPIPTAVRSLGAILVAAGLVGQFLVPWPTDFYLYYVGIAGGIILLFAGVGSNSHGAADNASGVAAVLEAAALVPAGREFGVLITDAEELVLAGARAWVAGRREKDAVVNCDTIDDDGPLTIIDYGNLRHEAFKGARVIGRARLPGVLTDSNAFRAAGWPTVTLARGTIRTLGRIHTRRDSLANLRGTGIPEAARLLARIVEELS
jgi:hypothetical protein